MGVREDGRTRLAVAVSRAQAAIAALRDGVPAMLVTATDRPRVAQPWTDDRALLRARLDALAALDVPGRLGPAVERAATEARARGGARVLVLSDLPPAAGGVSPATLSMVDWMAVGRRGDNLAVTALVVEQPAFAPPEATTVTATVRSFDGAPRSADLVATLDGTPWVRRPLALAPREQLPVVLGTPPASGVLAVSLEPGGDALAADDRALGWIAPRTALDLVVITDADATGRALTRLGAAMPGSRVEVVNAAGWRERGRADARQVALFDRTVPAGEPPAGGALYVAPPPGNDVCPCARAVDDGAAVVDWAAEDPVLRGLAGLEAIEVGHAVELRVPPWAHPLVEAASTRVAFPLLVAGERDGRRVACLAAELPIPLAVTDAVPFVVLLLNTLRWLGEPATAPPLVVDTGVPHHARLAAAPDAAGVRVRADAGLLVADRAGEHRLRRADGSDALVLASLLDDAESDVGREGPGEWTAAAPLAAASTAPVRRRVDAWCWAAALVLMAAEWAVWRRRA